MRRKSAAGWPPSCAAFAIVESIVRYPEREVMAIDALTKRNDEKDDYPRFIDRVLGNPLAAKVKLADIEDNLDVKRLDKLGPKDLERVAKYHAARRRLLGAR